jgi:DNA-binding MarR family transcriptional regulator/GNAT superfamily N-acetyltransferase
MSQVDAVRRFNRFYTRRIGVLPEGYLGMPYSLAEARIVWELGHAGEATATALGRDLELDLGYLSRLLQGLRRRGLVQAERSPEDGRQSLLALTDKGRKSYAALDARSREDMARMLAPLSSSSRHELAGAMRRIEKILDGKKTQKPKITLRGHRPGDMGWVIQRHGEIYWNEYGWDERFEALVAGVARDFIEDFDPARERCWIAELDGEAVGSVFLVKKNASTAKLRLLILDPRARGLGLGQRLVGECIAFAREKGYRKLVLWTQANLTAARAIYRKQGFTLVKSEAHRSFGAKLTGEYWAKKL